MEEDRVTVYFTKREVSPVVDKVWLFISQMESRVSLMEDSVFISQMQNGEILWSFHQRNKKWEEEKTTMIRKTKNGHSVCLTCDSPKCLQILLHIDIQMHACTHAHVHTHARARTHTHACNMCAYACIFPKALFLLTMKISLVYFTFGE